MDLYADLSYRRAMQPFSKHQSGQMIVGFAVAMSAFLAMMSLGVDLVSMYVHRRHAQGVADLAALAGAQKGSPADRIAEAQAIITANGYTVGTALDQATVCINPYYVENTNVCPSFTTSGGGGLEVTITYHTPTLFASILGTLVTDVFGRAVAFCRDENNYAIFGNSSTDVQGGQAVVDVTGSDIIVDGRVHSNADLRSQGANKTYNAGVTYVSTEDHNGNSTFRPGYPAQVSTQPWPIGPFDERSSTQFPCTYYFGGTVSGVQTVNQLPAGDFDLNDDGPWWLNGLRSSNVLNAGIYCAHDGEITLTGNSNDGSAGVTMVVDGNDGQITIHVRDIKPFGYVPPTPSTPLISTDPRNILFFAADGPTNAAHIDVNISSNGTWQGWIYAPNPGRPSIVVNGGSSSALHGGLFGDTVDMAGSGWSLFGTGPDGDCLGAMSE
jgi:Flp pilus assembly protein TadG